MTSPNPGDVGYSAALSRRLGLVLPSGQIPFDPLQFATPSIYATANDDASQQIEQQAMGQRQYMENSQQFQKPSNVNRRGSQNLKNADMSAKVIY
jgi:hypothetical protein